MLSIKQLKSEILNADYFNGEQKKWLLTKIDYAITQINLKQASEPKQYKIRIPKKAEDLMTLEQYEAREGDILNTSMFASWARETGLCQRMIDDMVQEFRQEMMAKGKKYANFRMAFQTYLRKGYLSKPLLACRLENSLYKSTTVIDRRGGEL